MSSNFINQLKINTQMLHELRQATAHTPCTSPYQPFPTVIKYKLFKFQMVRIVEANFYTDAEGRQVESDPVLGG